MTAMPDLLQFHVTQTEEKNCYRQNLKIYWWHALSRHTIPRAQTHALSRMHTRERNFTFARCTCTCLRSRSSFNVARYVRSPRKKPICVNGYSLCKEKEEERKVELKIAKALLIPRYYSII